MKTIKKYSINTLLICLLTLTFAITSCDNKKKTSEKKEVITQVLEKENNVDLKNEIKTRSYKMKDGTAIVYNLDTKGIIGFDDWNDYTVVNAEMADLRRISFKSTSQKIKNLNYRIANLPNTIPSWLKTEEVMEDVADILKEYKELIEDPNASEKEKKENLEELSEKFDDLKEELGETVDKYLEIHKEAIEEYNEEISKGKIAAAIEEYNEEIKKLDKIVEKKK